MVASIGRGATRSYYYLTPRDFRCTIMLKRVRVALEQVLGLMDLAKKLEVKALGILAMHHVSALHTTCDFRCPKLCVFVSQETELAA